MRLISGLVCAVCISSIVCVWPTCAESIPLPSTLPSRRTLLGSRSTVLSGTSLSDRLGGYDPATKEFHWDKYGEYVVERMAFAILVGVASIVFIPCFLVMRCLCNCCGGRKPSFGVCCVKKTKKVDGAAHVDPTTGVTRVDGKRVGGLEGMDAIQAMESGDDRMYKRYSPHSVFLLKTVAGGVLVAVAVLGIVLLVGNEQVKTGSLGLVDAVIDTGQEVLVEVRSIISALVDLPFTQDADTTTQDALNEATSLLDDARSVGKDNVEVVDRIRFYFLLACFLAPTLFLVVGLALGLVSITFCQAQIVLGMCMLLFMFLLWLSIALHIGFAIVFGDVCTEIDFHVPGEGSNSTLGDLIGCEEAAKEFDSLRRESQSGFDQSTAAACTQAGLLCSDPSSSPCPPACTSANLPLYVNFTIDGGTAGTITWQACASDCDDTNRKNQAAALLTNLAARDSYAKLMTRGNNILQCGFIDSLVARVDAALCDTFLKGLRMLLASQVLVAIACYVGTVVLIMGVKRFNSSYRADHGGATVVPLQPVGPPPLSYSDSDATGDDTALYSSYLSNSNPPPYDAGY